MLEKNFRFNPDYAMDSATNALRVAVSWRQYGGYGNETELKKWCEENNVCFDQVENFITALGWGGKFEYNQEFKTINDAAKIRKAEVKAAQLKEVSE